MRRHKKQGVELLPDCGVVVRSGFPAVNPFQDQKTTIGASAAS